MKILCKCDRLYQKQRAKKEATNWHFLDNLQEALFWPWSVAFLLLFLFVRSMNSYCSCCFITLCIEHSTLLYTWNGAGHWIPIESVYLLSYANIRRHWKGQVFGFSRECQNITYYAQRIKICDKQLNRLFPIYIWGFRGGGVQEMTTNDCKGEGSVLEMTTWSRRLRCILHQIRIRLREFSFWAVIDEFFE